MPRKLPSSKSSIKRKEKKKRLFPLTTLKKQEILSDGISKADFKLLKGMSKNSDLVIIKPDIDQGLVLMNKLDYINKVKVILEIK